MAPPARGRQACPLESKPGSAGNADGRHHAACTTTTSGEPEPTVLTRFWDSWPGRCSPCLRICARICGKFALRSDRGECLARNWGMSTAGSSHATGRKVGPAVVERAAHADAVGAVDLDWSIIWAGRLAKLTFGPEKVLRVTRRWPKGPERGGRARAHRSGRRFRLTASAGKRRPRAKL